MGVDVITSLSLLMLNVVFISLGGLGMSLLESKKEGKEVSQITLQIISAKCKR